MTDDGEPSQQEAIDKIEDSMQVEYEYLMRPMPSGEKQRADLIRKIKSERVKERVRQRGRLKKKREVREERLFVICGIVLVFALFTWAWWLSW